MEFDQVVNVELSKALVRTHSDQRTVNWDVNKGRVLIVTW